MLDEDTYFDDKSDDDDADSTSDMTVPIPPISIDDDGIHFDSTSNEQCKEQIILNVGTSNPLYPGANITEFQAVSILTSWFTLHPGISKSAFDRLLYLLHTHLLPTGNSLPRTYKEVQKSLQNLLTPTKVYHCCVNDCVIFRDSDTQKYAKLNHCPKCNEPRFKDGSNSIPHKRFIHLPLESRIRRLFSQPPTAQLFQQHLNDGKILVLLVMIRRRPYLRFMKPVLGRNGTVMADFTMETNEHCRSDFAPMVLILSPKKKPLIVCGQ